MKNILFLLILITSVTKAQQNLSKGYIILKNQSDTLSGLIDDQNWDINPKEITFQSGSKPMSKYQITDLVAFGVYGKDHYRTKKVNLDVTPFEINNLKKTSELDIAKDQVIALRLLLKANLSLLFLKEKNFKEHFFYENDVECKELINHKYLKIRDGKQQIYENKMFRTQLQLLFSDCAKSKKQNTLEYDSKKLIQEFISYNDCMGCSSVCYVETKLEKNTFQFGLVAGFTTAVQEEHYRDYFESINQVEKYISVAPNFGMSLNILSKRNNRDNVLSFELMYQKSPNRLLPNKFKAQIGSLQLSTIYKKKLQVNNSRKSYFGFGGKIAPNFISLKNSNQEYFDLKTNKLNIFGIGELGVAIKNLNIGARLNMGIFNGKVFNLNYKNVAEARNELSNSRINGQILIGYNF
jgi:hypothetical protein